MSNVWRLGISRAAEKDMRDLPSDVRSRVDQAVRSLVGQPKPSGCKKMTGYENTYRLRVGDYRILYDVDDANQIIYIWRIGHRQGIYR